MVPVVAFIGASGAGKTRLIVSLIQFLSAQGYQIGAIKHTHHTAEEIELGRPGKDSFYLKEAGADPALLVGLDHLAGMPTHPTELRLEELVERYCADCDLVLAEGFTESPSPKVIVQRSGVAEKPSIQAAWDRGEVIALVSDNVMPKALAGATRVRCFFLVSEPRKLANFLQEWFL
jgi:molybdopterin-guanine dinucleotide biosynthesis protein MobB